MSAGPIPWDRVHLYTQINGLDPALRPFFHKAIRQLDSVYLKWCEELSEDE